MTPMIYKNEDGYLDLMSDVLWAGIDTPDRTDVGMCRKLFNQTLYFDLRESFPSSTVRPMSLRYGFEELMMFLRGDTDTKVLEEKGIYFWKGHTSREFLDSRGLLHLPEGSLGESYSYQYRGLGEGYVDQLAKVYRQLKEDPYSRRHIIDIWAPNDHDQMPLTPCWNQFQFNVEKREHKDILHLTCNVRSSDILFGLPSNYQQFAFFLKAMSQLVGMEAGILHMNLTDCHIYHNQLEYVEEVLGRDFYPIKRINPLESTNDYENKVTLIINKELNTLDDLTSLQWEDIVIEGLKVNKTKFKTPKPKMAV